MFLVKFGLVGSSGAIAKRSLPYPGTSHVELTMAEHWLWQPHSNGFHCLTLCLIDCGTEGGTDRELSAGPFERILLLLWSQCNPWYVHFSVVFLSNCLAYHQSVATHPLEHQSGAVAQAFSWIEIS